tara:strand:- start:762 stop:1634 length:873 start_codon:yes stop_codon:yes gene_type:complete
MNNFKGGSKPKPKDMTLYNKVKARVYKRIPKHSAYRSGIVVSSYKKAFSKKYGSRKNPYSGKRTKKRGLGRWFKEKWVNQRGEVGYKYKSDIYRPSKRITRKTPTTHKELSRKQIKRARSEKRRTGRVKKFKRKKTRRKRRKMRGGDNECSHAKDGVSGCRDCCGEKYPSSNTCVGNCMNAQSQQGGRKMKETIVKMQRGPFPKKYTAIVRNKKTKKTRKIHFGDRRYQQFKDRTKLKLYKNKNHGTRRRMQNYYNRHSGTKKRNKAIKKERRKSKGFYNAKILSHEYLW